MLKQKKQTIKYLFILIFAAFFGVLLVTCVQMPRYWSQIDGVVLDRTTMQPLEGVFVLSVWEGSVPRVVEWESTYYRIDVVQTDKEGIFNIPSWLEPPDWIADKRVYLQYYKAGFQPDTWRDYDIRDFDMKGPVFMKKDARPNMERLEYLLGRSNIPGIRPDKRRRNKLFNYHKALHKEAASIVKTTEDYMLLQKIRYYIASEWNGEAEIHTFREGNAYFIDNLIKYFPGEPAISHSSHDIAIDKYKTKKEFKVNIIEPDGIAVESIDYSVPNTGR